MKTLSIILDTCPKTGKGDPYYRIQLLNHLAPIKQDFAKFLPKANVAEDDAFVPMLTKDETLALMTCLSKMTHFLLNYKEMCSAEYSDFRTNDIYTVASLMYTARAVILYVVCGQSKTFFRYALCHHEDLFTDEKALWERRPIFKEWWDRPFHTFSFSEAYALMTFILEEYASMNLFSAQAFRFLHNLEALVVKHVIFLQALDEKEHVSVRMRFLAMYRQIDYLTDLNWRLYEFPSTPDLEKKRSAFNAFVMKELKDIEFTNTQEVRLTLKLQSMYLRPGDSDFFRYVNPTDKMTAPGILVKERTNKELEEINEFCSFSNHTATYMYEHGSEVMRFRLLQALFEVLLLSRANVMLPNVCLENPPLQSLEQLDFGIVLVVNVFAIYMKGAFYRYQGSAMDFWFYIFYVIKNHFNNHLLGVPLDSFVHAWEQ